MRHGSSLISRFDFLFQLAHRLCELRMCLCEEQKQVGYDAVAHVYAHIRAASLAHKHFPSPAAQMQDNEAQVKKEKVNQQ